jgi:hypothetical protein
MIGLDAQQELIVFEKPLFKNNYTLTRHHSLRNNTALVNDSLRAAPRCSVFQDFTKRKRRISRKEGII